MYIQLDLFNTEQYNINPRLANLRNSMRLGWSPFSIDNLEKACSMYRILCEVVWKQYERILDEQPCDNSEN